MDSILHNGFPLHICLDYFHQVKNVVSEYFLLFPILQEPIESIFSPLALNLFEVCYKVDKDPCSNHSTQQNIVVMN